MRKQIETARLRRQIEKLKKPASQAAIKAEDLEASTAEIYNFKNRLVLFPRHTKNPA